MRSRLMLFAAICAVGCKRSGPEPTTSSGALRFLPATAEIALRIDLARARTWSRWDKASTTVFRSIVPPLEAVKKACDLDLLGEAKSLVFARGDDDITIVLAGLPKDKTAACPAKIGSQVPATAVVPDGDRFGITVEGKPFASGALLPSGELVLVSRKAQGVEAAAWKTEVEAATGAAPAWWSEVDQTLPIALRFQSPDRTVVGTAELGDPLVLRAKVDSPKPEVATADAARAKAIIDFLAKAEAGTGRTEPKGTTLYADFTATGPQIDKLLAAGLSTFGAEPQAPEAPANLDASPIECSALGPAVASYLTTNLEAMGPDQRAQTQAVFDKVLVPLQKAYVESCTAGAWSPQAIHCHVDSARNVPRFEKCRLVLTAEQRTKFDETVKAALATP